MKAFLTLVSILGMFVDISPVQAQPKHHVNTIGMKLMWLPPGTFTMGSSNAEKGRGDDEIQRKITFTRGIYLSAHTVTQAQWHAIMGDNPSHFKDRKTNPVESVSWHDAQAFCKKLTKKENKPYRLPTEAEWEYACRAGTTTAYHFGETISAEQGNYNATFVYGKGKPGIFRDQTMPVGSFTANAWGLFDMHGNVWQWCEDWHGGYAQKDVTDPQGPRTGKNRVLRGGSWGSHPIFCRSANRNFAEPESRNEYYGFRICFSAE